MMLEHLETIFFKQHCLCQSVRFMGGGGGGCMTHAMDTLPPCQQNIELQALGVVIVVAIVTEARLPYAYHSEA